MSGLAGSSNGMRGTAPETVYGCTGGAKLWRAQPHERIRHETRPAGSRRMKALRGRENLRAQAVGRGKPGHHAAAACGETLKGRRTSRKAVVQAAPSGLWAGGGWGGRWRLEGL
jgi:hypothetical protein